MVCVLQAFKIKWVGRSVSAQALGGRHFSMFEAILKISVFLYTHTHTHMHAEMREKQCHKAFWFCPFSDRPSAFCVPLGWHHQHTSQVSLFQAPVVCALAGEFTPLAWRGWSFCVGNFCENQFLNFHQINGHCLHCVNNVSKRKASCRLWFAPGEYFQDKKVRRNNAAVFIRWVLFFKCVVRYHFAFWDILRLNDSQISIHKYHQLSTEKNTDPRQNLFWKRAEWIMEQVWNHHSACCFISFQGHPAIV